VGPGVVVYVAYVRIGADEKNEDDLAKPLVDHGRAAADDHEPFFYFAPKRTFRGMIVFLNSTKAQVSVFPRSTTFGERYIHPPP
jgi:hypothetical protein